MRLVIGVVLAVGTAGAAAAQESLRVAVPEGFGLAYRVEAETGAIREFVPAGQTLDDWQEMLTVQRFAVAAGADPAGYLGAVLGELQAVCATPLATPVEAGQAPPYADAMAVLGCEVSPRTGGTEIFAIRAISGREAMHVVQFAWTRWPAEAEMGAALAILSGAVLCDPARADAPCPGWGLLP